ncbi:bacillithiol biosynthesis cysteine-adding enzyme BshC [Chengkuizengella sediminis]|uniref:bacillithiol biosynthesis cysteine-adding enzyme BshC n=1 Tax=Chengkuizengella sediminis TaxID=1885917 RepID=UPI001389B674|nr:bacillithiol biosynthesis cysteine-adding enzyme BshC [Chengkuizengella sediminis]NDI33677.1 bacillithiol biosynthesis cysteine-adding enzyme BshC [Chengkuizengella sediminis]
MKTEPFYIEANQPLANDYLHHYERVNGLYDFNPLDRNSISDRLNWLETNSHLKADRNDLSACLNYFNQKIGNSELALQNIEALKESETLVVVGGQQAGLFSGPLLTIYKIITIIKQAREASRQLNRKVVPVFWIAGEDHDFDEVNHIQSLSSNLKIKKIKVIPAEEGTKSTISELKIHLDDWKQVLESISEDLIETEFKAEILDRLNSIVEHSDTLVEVFAKMMVWLFGTSGLILLDSNDEQLRQLEIPMFKKLIEQNAVFNESIIYGKKRVESLAYSPQADIHENQSNLFYIHERERLLLHRTDQGEYADKQNIVTFTEEELILLLNQHPERFSNNVFTRPIMQEYLFPVWSTVLGPSEIAYWGLLKDVFHLFDMKLPIIQPRFEYTILESTIDKHMRKYDLSMKDVLKYFEDKKKNWLLEQDELNIEQQFSDVKKSFKELYEPVLSTIENINPGMVKLGLTNKQKIIEQISFLEKRSLNAFQSQHESSIRQLDRIQLSIKPLEKPQERVYNVITYLNKYGFDWIQQLIDEPIDNDNLHSIIYLP